MKKLYLISLALLLPATSYVIAGTSLLDTISKKLPDADSCFLSTHWKQMGGFEKYTPDHLRLGCWSTALAQIVYFHQLKPFGHVAYTSRKGYVIDQNIDSNAIDFNLMADRIENTCDTATINSLALYNYDAALAVNKDFGTDNYMNKLAPSSLLEAHYHIKASRYMSWKGLLPYTAGKQEAVIRIEIHARRPLFLHFANLKDFGHSVVIDGYKICTDHFYVHLNQGQGGPQDGWYDFEKDLLKGGDSKLRVLYTIRPISEN
jgi:Peptidase C10 family